MRFPSTINRYFRRFCDNRKEKDDKEWERDRERENREAREPRIAEEKGEGMLGKKGSRGFKTLPSVMGTSSEA